MWPFGGRLRTPKEYRGRTRFVLLTIALVLLILITCGLIAVAVLSANVSIGTAVGFLSGSEHLGTADRIALVTAEVAAATFLLAVLASVFAILAYAVSTRTPDIDPIFKFPGCQPDKPIVSQGQGDAARGTPLEPRTGSSGPLRVAVSFVSRNRWTAEHVMVRVRLLGMVLTATWNSMGWERDITTPAGAPVDTFQLQQALPLMYGQIMQRFWPLDLTGLRLTGNEPTVLVWVAAHGGYLRIRKLPVSVE